MNIKKISLIVGTRPQIIKTQPLVNSLLKNGFSLSLIHTGQHYDYKLSQSFFKELKIMNPTINLEVGKGSSLTQISKIVKKLAKCFAEIKPDLVIIPGDTTSALAAAISASKCRIKIAHLESGARSNQFHMAEEINRRLIDHCSDLLFAPTKNCLYNLKKESVWGKSFFVGDTMYDLFLDYYKKQKISLLKKNNSNKILITIHRAENIDNRQQLSKICKLINKINDNNFEILFPMHPHTKKNIKNYGLKLKIKPMEVIGYFDILRIKATCSLVITDSGGLQKEAYWMGKPCITLRETTEWVETVREKANFLFPISKELTIKNIEKISKQKIKPKGSLFGSGKASKKITSIIKKL